MRFLYFIEFIVIVTGAYMAITQIMFPLWKNTPMFPILRNGPKITRMQKEANEIVEESKALKNVDKTLKSI